MRCEFCDAFASGEFPPIGGGKILWEDGNFVIFPGLGQIVEGYLLIATKKHYLGMGAAPHELYEELETVMAKVRAVVARHYCAPVFFEHGSVGQCKRGGFCIAHAHIHAMPVAVDLLGVLEEKFVARKMRSFAQLRELAAAGTPYLFLETNDAVRYFFHVPDAIPSQYIRRAIAEAIGTPERWDWGAYLGLEAMRSTWEKLRMEFRSFLPE